MKQVQPLPPIRLDAVFVTGSMLNLRRRSTSSTPPPSELATGNEGVSVYRETLRNINWKLVVFCVALWWFIYSAPTEGILSPHFWAASSATDSDDF
jgi:hypothetical protein